MKAIQAKYYRLPVADGLEALGVTNHNKAFPAHYHPTFNISLVYNGVFQTRLHDKVVKSPPGSILITHPNEVHANPCEKDNSVSFFTFYLAPEFLSYCNAGSPAFFEQQVIEDIGLFTGLHQLTRSIDNGNQLSFENKLLEAFKILSVKHGTKRKNQESAYYPLFEEYIAEENFEKFSLADAAKKFGIDRYKFLRLFKFQTGLTPGNYFILKRIETSKAMLTEGRDLLSIAIDLGFYDTAHFCNHFKSFTGISPLAYATGK